MTFDGRRRLKMDQKTITGKTEDRRKKYLSKIQGSLIGGAAGDALGYEVEFMRDSEIQRRFGPEGITAYVLHEGKALFSDDTQMTLFTANGLLYGETCASLHGTGKEAWPYIRDAYKDWLYTQDPSRKPDRFVSWLVSVPELHSRRAPGMTCMSAMRSKKVGTIEKPLNDSCGCGGVMRTAPVGLFYGHDDGRVSPGDIVRYGAYAAAFTHGHPWGYIPAGMLSLIVARAAFGNDPLPKIISDSFEVTKAVFDYDGYWGGFAAFIQKAVDLSGNDSSDRENIRQIGEGWVGHEALAIAIYAALRYEHDFSKALIAAVNHDGDSDSTGAVCGNILGAYLGMEGIGPQWTENLELRDTILEMGRDLCSHCQMTESGGYADPEWQRKYADICGVNGTNV